MSHVPHIENVPAHSCNAEDAEESPETVHKPETDLSERTIEDTERSAQEDTASTRLHNMRSSEGAPRSSSTDPGLPEDAAHAPIIAVDSPRHSASTTTPVWDRNEDLVECTRQSIPSGAAASGVVRDAGAAVANVRQSPSTTDKDSGHELETKRPRSENIEEDGCTSQAPRENFEVLNSSRGVETGARECWNEHKGERGNDSVGLAPRRTPCAECSAGDIISNGKGTLHISNVRDVNVRVSFGEKNHFLRVSTCNHLVRIKPANGLGELCGINDGWAG